MLQRFLARAEEPPVEYRALRRLEAQNPKFKQSAWMLAWTEYDHVNGFRYQIVDEGGSGYIRNRRCCARRSKASRKSGRTTSRRSRRSTTTTTCSTTARRRPTGSPSVGVKPKRKDVLLVEGAIFVQPSDGELSRIEGKLSKTPSFWTRRVDVVRRYERKAGVRVPVAIESVAQVLIAGPLDVQDDLRVPDDQRTARRRSASPKYEVRSQNPL